MDAMHTEPTPRTVPIAPMSNTAIDAGRPDLMTHPRPLATHWGVRWDLETIMYGIGVLDQAVLGLLELPRFRYQRELPRSYFLEASQLHLGLGHGQHDPLMSRLRSLAMGGAFALRLVKSWKGTMAHRPALTAQDRYKVISLAAASILIPWLLLRGNKRS